MGNLSVIPTSGLPSAETIVANVTILTVFAGLVVAGIMRGLKEVREFRKPSSSSESPASQIAAATILENATLASWSESNRAVVTALGVLTLAIDRMCNHLSDQVDETASARRETTELRRAIEDAQRALGNRGG